MPIINYEQHRIEYHGPGDDGTPVKDQGWRVYEARYQSHRLGRPVQRAQKPRWVLVGVFATREEAEQAVVAAPDLRDNE